MTIDGRQYAGVGKDIEFGGLAPSAVTDGVVCFLVDQITFCFSAVGVFTTSTVRLEGRVGDKWFPLISTVTTITGAGGSEVNVGVTYDKCRSLEQIRAKRVADIGGVPTINVYALPGRAFGY